MQNLRALAGSPRWTKSGRAMNTIFSKFDLPKITPLEFDTIFSSFSEDFWRTECANAVQGFLRSRFSAMTSAEEEADIRTARTVELERKLPLFYDRLRDWLDDQRARASARFFLKTVRKSMRNSGVPNDVIEAATDIAVFSRPDCFAWQRRGNPTQLIQDLVLRFPDAVTTITSSIPTPPPESALDRSRPVLYRRFASKERPLEELAKDYHLARALIGFYQEATAAFSPEEAGDLIPATNAVGPARVHLGWLRLIKSRAPEHVKAVGFLSTEVREWFRARQPPREGGKELERLVFNPLFPFGQRGGWRWRTDIDTANNDEIAAEFPVPGHSIQVAGNLVAADKRTVVVRVRGQQFINRADVIVDPLEVKDGLRQFRPDRVQAAFGSDRRTFSKAQALRLSMVNGVCCASISTRSMTEQRRALKEGEKFPDALKSGDRVAVLHLLCRGSVLGDLSLFEKGIDGWRQINLSENVLRSDEGAYSDELNLRNTIRKVRPFVRFDVSSLDLQLSLLEKQETDEVRGTPVDTNRQLLNRFGRIRADSGATEYKRLSSRIGRILVENCANVLLVAGGTFGLTGRSGIRHPIAKFFTLAAVDGYKRPKGFLVNSLNRAGVPICISSARAVVYFSKDFLENRRINKLRRGRPWRERCNRELIIARSRGYADSDTRISEYGAPTHYTVEGKTCPYAINSAWSLLLYWTDERYRALVEKASSGNENC